MIMPQRRLLQTMGVGLLAVGIELMLGVSMMASAQIQFKPPNIGRPTTTAGGGVRFSPVVPRRISPGTPREAPLSPVVPGAPTGTAGSAIRVAPCSTEKTPLTALVPSSKSGTFGLTTETHPTFFVYLPKPTAQSAEFVLTTKDGQDVYRATMPLSGQSGLVSVQLPATAPALGVGQFYQWHFSVICDPNDRVKDNLVSAWVQRVQPDPALAAKLADASARQRPGIYADAGIWQDTLTTLAALRRAHPADPTLIKDWNSLLESVGLGAIVKAVDSTPVTPLTVNTPPPP